MTRRAGIPVWIILFLWISGCAYKKANEHPPEHRWSERTGTSSIDHDSSQSFKKQYFTISGSVEIPDVKFKGFPRDPVSDASGRYSVDIPFGWSGTVTPVKKGYLFEPAERVYFNIKESAQAQDYIPRQKYLQIKGSTGLAGVHLTGLPEQLLTGPNGTYNTNVPYHWTGCITPQKDGYQFNPPKRMYTRVEHDWLHEDYTAQPIRQVSPFGPGKGDKPDLSFEDRRWVLIIGLDNGHDDIEKRWQRICA